MMKTDKNFIKRCVLMAVGILFIGICVGAFRLSAFGVDAFTCMNLGISGFLRMSFGTWQLIMNAAILALVFFTARRCIGAGTIVNMVGVGYMADFICWLFQEVWEVNMTLPLRILALVTGSLLAGIGVAFYMAAEMGIAPYDSVALIIEKGTNGKIKFQYARVLSDITVVIVGVAFCLRSGGDLRLIIGIGTVCNALFNGPLIQFFKVHAAEPLLKK
ncbi:MAG: hypothetical protein HFH11_09660 [Dorea sp.]|nr:hypothetical protein [Dorea sp.]